MADSASSGTLLTCNACLSCITETRGIRSDSQLILRGSIPGNVALASSPPAVKLLAFSHYGLLLEAPREVS